MFVVRSGTEEESSSSSEEEVVEGEGEVGVEDIGGGKVRSGVDDLDGEDMAVLTYGVLGGYLCLLGKLAGL